MRKTERKKGFMRSAKLLLAIGPALLLAVLSVAQPTLQSISVVVQVTDCATQAPIQEAKVTIIEKATRKVLAQGFTDAQGRFSAVILILAFGIADALERIDVLIEKAGFQVQQLMKVVLPGPFGQFISVSACMIRAGAPQEQLICSPLSKPSGPTLTLQLGQSLQQAIDQAPEGAVIQLQPGEYSVSTSLRITKSISLIGLGTKPDPTDPSKTVPDPEKVVLRGNRSEPVIELAAEGKVRIENLSVREGSGAGPTERGGGIHIENSRDVSLRCVVLTENIRFGLVALLSQLRIEEGQVVKTRPTTPGRDGQGLRLKGSKVQVFKTVIRENGAQGLAARDADDEPSIVTVEESTIEQNVFSGLSVFDGSKLTVRKSRIANNQPFQGQFGDGVFAGAFSELVLEENVIEGHRPQGQFARWGVFITEEVKAVLRGNTIKNNAWGVGVGDHASMRETIRAEFYNNTITRSDSCGLWIDEDEGIKILGSGNTIMNNGQGPRWNICGATGKVPPGF